MKRTLKQFFLKKPSNYVFWILLALLVKGVIPFLQLYFAHRSNPHILSLGFIGDGPSYIDPIENLIKTGHYSPDRRMPGYGIIYLIFRFFFPYDSTYNIIIITQLVVSSLSVYCLALLSRSVLKYQSAFYITFYLFLISTYSNYYDTCLGTESFCSAFLIFGTWYFMLYFEKRKLLFIFLAGIFLTWATFLRPVFALILFFYGLAFLIYSVKTGKRLLSPLLLFSMVFFIADATWIARNYYVHHKFIPLARGGFYYPYVEYSYMSHELEFIQTWGGAVQLPDEQSALSWFGGILFPSEPEVKNFDSIPDDIYTSRFDRDSLYKLRDEVKLFMAMQKPALDRLYNDAGRDWNKIFPILYKPLKPVSPIADSLQNDINRKFDIYRKSIKNEHPFIYYIKGPSILLYKLLFKNNADYFKRFQFAGIGKFSYLFFYLYYIIILLLGTVGMLFLFFKGIKENVIYLFLVTIPLYTILIHPILRAAYNRFLLPVWPFIIVCAVYVIIIIVNRILKRGKMEQLV